MPQSTALTARVMPFVDVESLRVVVVLAWPANGQIDTAPTDEAEESGGGDEESGTTDSTGGETTDTTETPDTTTADG